MTIGPVAEWKGCRRRRMRPVVAGLCLILTACGAGWRRTTDLDRLVVQPRQQAQLWVEGRATQVHGVSFTSDSLYAIPFHKPLDCDSCRLAWPLAQVDSVRVGHPVAGFWKTVGLAVGIPLALLVIICASEKGCPVGD